MAPNMSPITIRNTNAKQLCNQKDKIEPPIEIQIEHEIDTKLLSIINNGYNIAKYYIPYHLRCSCKHELLQGLPKSFVVPPAQPPELYLRVATFSYGMEKKFEAFFEQIPTHMKLKNENAKEIFISLCRRVVSSDVNWGRVISIFTVGGAFAVHFVNKGQLDIVKSIPGWVQEVLETTEGLPEWIQEQGGWEKLSLRSKDDLNNASWSSYVTVGFGVAAAGMLLFGLSK
ncbi:bcl-2-like protein 2 [Clytia hemisphaerica]|uniref:Bcl-2 Bcl-2 homology region 1-3 domain-containing protein n=1 Tax=Clytia hemisphaerica TaxID=252671 RepID=A0A7M5WRB5_9CNID|eukprot:TCONS_00008000-protein